MSGLTITQLPGGTEPLPFGVGWAPCFDLNSPAHVIAASNPGVYTENQSRLSDISVKCMIEAASDRLGDEECEYQGNKCRTGAAHRPFASPDWQDMRRIMRWCNVLYSGLDETELDLACYGLFEIAQIIACTFNLLKFKPADPKTLKATCQSSAGTVLGRGRLYKGAA